MMVLVTEHMRSQSDSSTELEEKKRRLFGKFGQFISNSMPKGLYTRALIIIIAPIVLLESVVAFIFMERHWETVTRRLSMATSRDIAMLISTYETLPKDKKFREQLTQLARDNLNLSVHFLPLKDLPPARAKPFFGLLDRTLSDELRKRVGRPFWVDTVGRSNHVEIRVKLDDSVIRVIARRSQTYASNSHIFLVWMIGVSLVLITVAILFLRNQIKPILRLATAADSFGKGRPVPEDFRPRGAREVRQASRAFIEMRDRIERHVEQRTTMLAGVSHDLRTILTRFKLQLALFDDTQELDALHSDINEMQQMLEDYMAFAKGDGSEETVLTDVGQMLEELRTHAARLGKTVKLTLPSEPIFVPLRRHAFKRALANLVSNAERYANHIILSARRDAKVLTIEVEDDGPGIPEKEREQVFRPFYRIDGARNQDIGNTGLGLSITRDIAHGHGGDVTLHRSELGGLKAVLTIPV
ncbi:osmolarity sensor protein EnvZ [bacterium MnTg02]|nr:osmolarity sensor protein EnvZ [bacterium MnTg02]